MGDIIGDYEVTLVIRHTSFNYGVAGVSDHESCLTIALSQALERALRALVDEYGKC